MFAAMGTRVTLVDARDGMLPFVDREIAVALRYLLRKRNVTFQFGEEVVRVERKEERVITHLKSGKQIASHTLLYATGRQGATDGLGLEAAGLSADERGRIGVDDQFRTAVPHIYAVGDVSGPPGPRGDQHGAGPHRRAHRLRRTGHAAPGPRARRHLRDPGDLVRRPQRGGAHAPDACRTSSALPGTASSRRR